MTRPPSLTRRARKVQRGHVGRVISVVGLGSRGIVYGSLTALVLQVALADKHSNTDQGSALALLGRSSVGSLVLVLLVVGVGCFVLWRWSQAWLGSAGAEAGTRLQRVQAFVEGLAYVPFGYLSVSVLAGDPGPADQGRQYRTLSGRVLQNTAGQVLVALVGAVVVVIGGFFVYQGVRRTFEAHLDFAGRPRPVRQVVLWLGTVGSVGRGLIFAMAGVLVFYAAVTVEPGAAGGLDAALDTLRRQAFGTWLLVLAALGFASFALFALAEAAFHEG